MTDLATWANVAEVVGLIAILGGAGFAWYQIREARQARADASSLTVLMAFLEDEQFFLALNQVMSLPDKWHETPDVRDAPETQAATNRVYQTLEMLGYFVYARQIRLEDVQELAGSGIRQAWARMEGYAEVSRDAHGPHAFEWYQWLADRLGEAGAPDQPAHLAHASWTP